MSGDEELNESKIRAECGEEWRELEAGMGEGWREWEAGMGEIWRE